MRSYLPWLRISRGMRSSVVFRFVPISNPFACVCNCRDGGPAGDGSSPGLVCSLRHLVQSEDSYEQFGVYGTVRRMSIERLTPTSYLVLGLLAREGPSTPYDLERHVAATLG